MIDTLLDNAPAMPLSTLRFFEPRPVFGKLMEQYRGTLIYDVGAGVGHVSRYLANKGHEVIALDINRRDDEVFPIQRSNAMSFPYRPGSVVLLCRPSHGVFPEYVMRNALSRRCIVLYVGLSSNVEMDLDGFTHYCHATNVGREKEDLYIVRS